MANILVNINSGVLGVLLIIFFGDPICVQPIIVMFLPSTKASLSFFFARPMHSPYTARSPPSSQPPPSQPLFSEIQMLIATRIEAAVEVLTTVAGAVAATEAMVILGTLLAEGKAPTLLVNVVAAVLRVATPTLPVNAAIRPVTTRDGTR